MEIQKQREAFKEFIANKYKDLIDQRVCINSDGDYMAWDMQVAWATWQAATAQAVPEMINVGNELQSWVAINSFSADDGEGVLPVVDANALAEVIEKLTGASQ